MLSVDVLVRRAAHLVRIEIADDLQAVARGEILRELPDLFQPGM